MFMYLTFKKNKMILFLEFVVTVAVFFCCSVFSIQKYVCLGFVCNSQFIRKFAIETRQVWLSS